VSFRLAKNPSRNISKETRTSEIVVVSASNKMVKGNVMPTVGTTNTKEASNMRIAKAVSAKKGSAPVKRILNNQNIR